MLVAKSVKSVSGKVVLFVNDERGQNSVFIYEKNRPDPIAQYDQHLGRKESIEMVNRLSMTV